MAMMDTVLMAFNGADGATPDGNKLFVRVDALIGTDVGTRVPTLTIAGEGGTVLGRNRASSSEAVGMASACVVLSSIGGRGVGIGSGSSLCEERTSGVVTTEVSGDVGAGDKSGLVF